ncbi:MAG: hypothetical protein ABSA11_11975 [Candidatus Bathyarchaeia archaeon]
MNRLLMIGVALLVGGVAVAEVSYYRLYNVLFTIIGLVCMIVGAIIIQIPTFATGKRRLRAMVEGSYTGVEKLLKEKGVESRAIYLPPNEEVSLVYVAIGAEQNNLNIEVSSLKEAVEADLEGRGLVFPAPGYVAVKTTMKGSERDVRELLRSVVVDALGAAESIIVKVNGESVILELKLLWQVKNRPRCLASMGSLPVSVAGSALSAWFKSPVAFEGEKVSGSGVVARFRIIKG